MNGAMAQVRWMARRGTRMSGADVALAAGIVAVAVTLLAGGWAHAQEPGQAVAPAPAGGTPDGIVLQKFPDLRADPLYENQAKICPMIVFGFNDPLLIRSNTAESLIDGVMVPAYGRPLVYPRGRIAQEYGITSKVLGPSPIGPMPGVLEGLRAMFGYQSKDGFRAEPDFFPTDMDLAEAVRPDGTRELLIALSGNLSGHNEAGELLCNILPYRFVYMSAVSLYRMEKPAPGQSPDIKCVLTYVHPGMVHDVDIEQWKDAQGKNHIICLAGGNDDYIGGNAMTDYRVLHNMQAPPFSSNSPSIFYLSFYPKGPSDVRR